MSQTSTQHPRPSLPLGPRVESVLREAYLARKPVLLEGPTGIGKSEVVARVAAHLGIEFRVFDLSVLEQSDLLGLMRIRNGLTEYARPAELPGDGQGILMLEELNRAPRYMRQPALQLLTARRLHAYHVPEAWSMAAAINPDDAGYDVDTLDEAMRCRFLQLRVHADRSAWIEWARENGVHPLVLRIAQTHDRIFEGVAPRTWKYVSDLLPALLRASATSDVLLRDALGGYLPPVWVEALLEARPKALELPGLESHRLLSGYANDPAAQGRIAVLLADGRTDLLDTLVHRLASLMADDAELRALLARNGFDMRSFERLLADLPGDRAETLQRAFGASAAAAALLEVSPDAVLDGYSGSPAARTVDRWCASRHTRHRAWALATAVALRLAGANDIDRLRRSGAVRGGIACLLRQAGGEAASLRRVAERLGIPLPALRAA